MKTSFRGPLVAQTSTGRLAQTTRIGCGVAAKLACNEPVQRHLSRGVLVARIGPVTEYGPRLRKTGSLANPREAHHARLILSPVSRTGNAPRVRDGYVRLSTNGNGRTLPTHGRRPICRTNVAADVHSCTPIPPLNLHGKEGVNGSSPLEGSAKAPLVGAFAFRSTCSSSIVQWVWSRFTELARLELGFGRPLLTREATTLGLLAWWSAAQD
jgi:hypothetical protein